MQGHAPQMKKDSRAPGRRERRWVWHEGGSRTRQPNWGSLGDVTTATSTCLQEVLWQVEAGSHEAELRVVDREPAAGKRGCGLAGQALGRVGGAGSTQPQGRHHGEHARGRAASQAVPTAVATETRAGGEQRQQQANAQIM